MPIRLAGDWAPKAINVKPFSWNDLAVINLEGPVLKNPSGYDQSQKAGPCLHHTSLPSGIEKIVYALANNHIMDYSEKGLDNTLAMISHTQAFFCGAGGNLNASRKPLVIEHEGIRVGVISRCETQFGIATNESHGACPIDPTIYNAIKKLREDCDIMIVSLHAAAEMSPWPSPQRQDLCRSLIESGANIVHGHHSHIPQGWERYGGGYIFYGLGNLCVDPSSWSSHNNALWSLTPRLIYSKGKYDIEIKTSIIKSLDDNMVEILDSSIDQRSIHDAYLEIANLPLTDRNLLEGLWQEVSIDLYQSHFGLWLGLIKPENHKSKIIWRAFKGLKSKTKQFIKNYILTDGATSKYNNSCCQQMLWYHLFACESHSTAISCALGVLSGVIPDKRSPRTNALFKAYQES